MSISHPHTHTARGALSHPRRCWEGLAGPGCGQWQLGHPFPVADLEQSLRLALSGRGSDGGDSQDPRQDDLWCMPPAGNPGWLNTPTHPLAQPGMKRLMRNIFTTEPLLVRTTEPLLEVRTCLRIKDQANQWVSDYPTTGSLYPLTRVTLSTHQGHSIHSPGSRSPLPSREPAEKQQPKWSR